MAERRRLLEGFSKGVANGIRRFFARSPQNQVIDMSRGGTPAVERAGLPYNLVSQFGYDFLAAHLYIDQDLQVRYTDYEEMDEYPEISVALDIYADDSTTPDLDREQAIWVQSPEKKLADELNEVLHKRALIEEDIWGVSRTLCKYGSVFGELLVSEDGLVGINFLPPPTVRRVEDPRGLLLGFIQDIQGRFNISLEDFYRLAQQRSSRQAAVNPPGVLTVFEDWEIVHWRLRGKHLRSIYGHGVIDPARWIWKRLSLLEDALLIYKLERAPSRYAFYIDVGELDAERGLAYVNRVKNAFTRKKFVNPTTGQMDMRFNPLSFDEDFYVPVRGGKRTTEIDVLQGPDYTETESLEYHRDKLVSSLKIPKTYMGYGGEATRNALSSEDIRFARTVMRIQRVLRAGFRKALRVHLVARGVENPDEMDFDCRMNVPSQILALARIEVMSATADLAGRMGEQVSSRWLLTHLYKFSEAEATQIMKEREEEKVRTAEVEFQASQVGQEQGGGEEGGYPESRNPIASDDAGVLEQRLSKLIRAVAREDWRREFDGNPKADSRLDSKLEKVLKENEGVRRQLRSLEGLLRDVKQGMRSAGVTPL